MCPNTILFHISSFETINLYILKPTIIFADLNQVSQLFVFFIFEISLHISVVFLHFSKKNRLSPHQRRC